MTQTLLSDEALEKVSVIEDINKLKMFLDGSALEPEHFDHLYDLDIGRLVTMQDELSVVAGIKAVVKNFCRDIKEDDGN